MPNRRHSLRFIATALILILFISWQWRDVVRRSPEKTASDKTMRLENGYHSLVPGELPGYTGWARPEDTLARFLRPGHTVPLNGRVGETWHCSIVCQGDPRCNTSNSWFYIRAYGTSIIVGDIQHVKSGHYEVRLDFPTPGQYMVEVVLTFSDPPAVELLPLTGDRSPMLRDLYEGYYIHGFPVVVDVEGEVTQLPIIACQPEDWIERDTTVGRTRASWIISDHNRDPKHVTLTNYGVSKEGYQASQNSVGFKATFRHKNCNSMPAFPNNPLESTIQAPIHFILIGDSVMRLQRDLLEKFAQGNELVKISFIELYGGFLYYEYQQRLSNAGGGLIQQLLNVTSNTSEKRVIVANTGMHDIHRLCGAEFAMERNDYLGNTGRQSCISNYRKLMRDFAGILTTMKAHVRLFQTTSAAWPKFGNYGIAWDPTGAQRLPLDSNVIVAFNEVVFEVLADVDTISVVDGYWVSLARPDNREIGKIGKKLSHPGNEVIDAMIRIWWTIAQHYIAKNPKL